MATEGVEKLRELWRQLEFFTVQHSIAREPEDVAYIDILKVMDQGKNGQPVFGGFEPANTFTRLGQVPAKDRWRARVVWANFHGFTTDGVRFDLSNYTELNWSLEIGRPLELDPQFGRRQAIDLPAPGQLICGVAAETPTGTQLTHWFVADKAFQQLASAVVLGAEPSQKRINSTLLKDDSLTVYWAVAQLVLRNDVQVFVDWMKANVHTRQGREQLLVDWSGRAMTSGFAQFIHTLSYLLNEPRWWQRFRQLTFAQGVMHRHPGLGGICLACMADNPNWAKDYTGGDGRGNNWPYQKWPS